MTLSKLCNYVVLEKSRDHLSDFLCEIFNHIRPAGYHNKLAVYRWDRIYTTNIDDLVEHVYDQKGIEIEVVNKQRPSTIPPKGRLEYFKLHADVNNSDAGFVFSTEDYLASARKITDYRFNNLMIDFQSRNFIFIGTSFDELNIDYYLKLYEDAGHESLKGDLFFITPSPSLYLRAKVAEMKGHIITWTAEKFLDFLDRQDWRIPRSDNRVKKLNASGIELINNVKASFQTTNEHSSMLYFGYVPGWDDIFLAWDFKNPLLHRFTEAILNRHYNIAYFVVYGKALSGKTSFMKRLAVELVNEDYEVMYFNGSHIDVREISRYIDRNANHSNFALLVDNASFHYVTLKNLVAKMPADKRLAVITSARPVFHFKKRYYLSSLTILEEHLDTQIDDAFAHDIVSKLKSKGFIGRFRDWPLERQVRFFAEKNDLVAALFELTYGSGYVERLGRELETVLRSKDDDFHILLSLCIFDLCELPYYPRQLITMLYGKNVTDVTQRFHDFVKTDVNGNLGLRMDTFSRTVFEKCTKKDVVDNIKETLIHISPRIVESREDYTNNMFQALCKFRYLAHNIPRRAKVPINPSDLKRMLYDLRNYLGDFSYYWLQLGLAEQATKDYAKALNHFHQAKSIRPRSYMIDHAIGRNYLRQANDTDSRSEAKALFVEGEGILLKLIKNRERQQVRSYSIHCYLNECIRFFEKHEVPPTADKISMMLNLLEKLDLQDENDVMSRHISNRFLGYLRSIGKGHKIKIGLHDLHRFKYVLSGVGYDLDELSDEFESGE